MDEFEDFFTSDLPWERKERIMRARQPAKSLLRLGLPTKVIKRVLDDSEPCAFKGTTHRRKISDLRRHHLTQHYQNPKYASKDLTYVALEASRKLREKRSKITESSNNRSIPLPGCTKGKQPTKIYRPQQTTPHEPSSLSHEVDVNEIGAVSAEGFDEMQDFYERLCNFGGDYTNMVKSNHNTYINWSTDEEAEDDLEVAGSSPTEPDDYDIEMAKAFDSVSTGRSERHEKRKWEFVSAPEELLSELSGQVEREEKRRKLEIGTNFSQVPPPGRRSKSKNGQGGKLQPHYLFCRSSTLAAVFEAALAFGTLEAPQKESSDTSELGALDLELLGEEPSRSELAQSSDDKDLKLAIAEALYPLVDHGDLRVAIAAANLMDIDQENSSFLELGPADRDTLEGAFGHSDDLQPSANVEEKPLLSDAIPRTTRFSDRCVINKMLIIENGYGNKFKRDGKPIGPSKRFQSFFATRRLRKRLLRQDRASWNDEDASFVVSGKKIEEPEAELGAEYVAKSLLDGHKSPLRKILRDSQTSIRKRQKRDSSSVLRVLSRKDERKIAQVEKSGLSKKMAQPKAGEIRSVPRAKTKDALPEAEGTKTGSENSSPNPVPELDTPFSIKGLMPEVEDELAKWEEEERQQEASQGINL